MGKLIESDGRQGTNDFDFPKDPERVESDNAKFPKAGHIMELLADYNTKRDQSIIIYFKYKRVPDNFITTRMYANEYKVLVDSLGEDLYLKIYNKLKEYYGN